MFGSTISHGGATLLSPSATPAAAAEGGLRRWATGVSPLPGRRRLSAIPLIPRNERRMAAWGATGLPADLGIDARRQRRKSRADSMSAARAIPILVSALLSAGCTDARGRAVKTVKRVTPEQLRKDAAHYYKDVFASRRKTMVTLNPQSCSWSFSELRAARIIAYPDGFAFCLETKGDTESGLYIVPLGMEHEPTPTRWASFEKLSEGIFWYSFKP